MAGKELRRPVDGSPQVLFIAWKVDYGEMLAPTLTPPSESAVLSASAEVPPVDKLMALLDAALVALLTAPVATATPPGPAATSTSAAGPLLA